MANNYVDPIRFNTLLTDYKKGNETDKKIWNELGKCFLLIAKRQLMRMNFLNYSQERQNDMVSLACLYMIRYYKNFDVTRGSSAFAYFTQIAYRASQQILNIYKVRDNTFCSLDFITSKESINVSENYSEED